jgi:nucleotide-binding universal stress UspA family protein
MYKRILAPVDGSHTSTRGLQEAVQLAKDHRAKLRLMHVVDESVLTLNPEAFSGTGEFMDALIDGGKQTLKKARALADRHGVKAEAVMYENFTGNVADVILKEVQKWRADVIVMGTHGRRGISHAILGSDAEAVVRASPVPVLLVRGAPAKKRRPAAARK